MSLVAILMVTTTFLNVNAQHSLDEADGGYLQGSYSGRRLLELEQNRYDQEDSDIYIDEQYNKNEGDDRSMFEWENVGRRPTEATINALIQSRSVKIAVVGVLNGNGFAVSLQCEFNVIKVDIDINDFNFFFMNIEVECNGLVKIGRVRFKFDASATIKIRNLQFINWTDFELSAAESMNNMNNMNTLRVDAVNEDVERERRFELFNSRKPRETTINALIQSRSVKIAVVAVLNGNGFAVTLECDLKVIKVDIDINALNFYFMNIEIECNGQVKIGRVRFNFEASAMIKIRNLQFINWTDSELSAAENMNNMNMLRVDAVNEDVQRRLELFETRKPTEATINALIQSRSIKIAIVGVLNGNGFAVTIECDFTVIKVDIDINNANFFFLRIRVECNGQVKIGRVRFEYDASATIKMRNIQFMNWIN